MLKQIIIALLFMGSASAQADITLSGGTSLVITSSMAGSTISCGSAPVVTPVTTPLLEMRKVGYYYYAVQPTTGMNLGVGFGDFPETLALLQRAVQNVVGRNACINFDGDHWAVTDIYTGVKRNSNRNSLDQCLVELYSATAVTPVTTPLLEMRREGYFYYAVQPTTGMNLGVAFGNPSTVVLLQRAVQNVVGRNACINFDGDHWAVTDIYTGVKLNSNPNSLDQCLVELYSAH